MGSLFFFEKGLGVFFFQRTLSFKEKKVFSEVSAAQYSAIPLKKKSAGYMSNLLTTPLYNGAHELLGKDISVLIIFRVWLKLTHGRP